MPFHWERYAWAVLNSVVCTAIAFAMYAHFELVNLVMVYLLGVTVAGIKLGRGPSAIAAVLNVAAFDFCFVPPRFTLAVSDAQYLVTFAVMLTVALVIANLMASVRQQTRVAGARERRTALLYAMSRELAATRGTAQMARVAIRHVAEVFACKCVILHARCGRQAALSKRSADGAIASRSRILPSHSGSPTTGSKLAWARTPCRRRLPCTCR